MILTLEQQVCSLESAKKLKELGFRQESLFYWNKLYDINCEYTGDDLEVSFKDILEFQEMEKSIICSAYTASELGVFLPSTNLPHRYCEGWWVILNSEHGILNYSTEVEARAKMLIYLAENGLIEGKK